MPTTKKKTCSMCKKRLPLDQFNRASNTKDGRQYYCIICQKSYRLKRARLKICDTCKKAKPISRFYKSRITGDGLFPTCKDCCGLEKKGEKTFKQQMEHYKRYFSRTRYTSIDYFT